jgi:SAM-dependent methyltransferase
MTGQSNSSSQSASDWNPSPSSGEGSFGYEAINRLILYGFLGYLPEDASNALILSGPKQAETAILLEENGLEVTMLCDPDTQKPGCLQSSLDKIESDSFDLIIAPGWLSDFGATEKVARLAKDVLKEKGLFVSCFAGRYAAAMDIASKSVEASRLVVEGEDAGSWHGTSELYSPNEAICMLEAVGFEVVDLFGWQMAISRMGAKKLGTSDWSDDELNDILDLEFRLGQERSLLGCAPTIQFIAKKSTGASEDFTVKPSDVH